MRIISLFFFLAGFFCIFSCTSLAKDKRLYTNITDSSRFYLLPPEGIEQNMDMVQYMTAAFRDSNYFLIAYVKADETVIDMAFFNELGAGIGELSYIDGKVNFTSNVIPKAFLRYVKPEYIIADFQLCFYDPVILEKELEVCGLVLEVQGDNRRGNRRILNGEEIIIEIIKTDTTVRLDNLLRGYAYTMEGEFNGGSF